ncbi:hypothetical protein BDV41DRAFT_570975 [Aspergillus transmontanensis]|uniref:Thioester reductase (TE) domain-containing protein n=1 Tax=Aspergillus transmontanensis TaxID=1034304 RepID=A0A5N6WEU7_9EURO|nr:hypothetical protein BDV41DRAFT_570975 [Aspergillus transmontanensis]
MVTDDMEDGFPISIYRLGAVFCQSVTGVGSATDFVSRLIVSCVRIRYFPPMPHQSKNFIPVNYQVEAMILISQLDESVERTYNMVPEMSISGGMPYEEWLNRVQAKDNDDHLRPLLPMLEEKVYDGHCRWEMYENLPIYDTENLRRHLQGIPELATCPTLDRDIFKNSCLVWDWLEFARTV